MCTIVCCGRFGTWSITESLMTAVICSVQYCWLISYNVPCWHLYTYWVKSNANTLTPVLQYIVCSVARYGLWPVDSFIGTKCIVLLWSILVSSRRRFTYVVETSSITSNLLNFTFVKSRHNPISDKMKQTALSLYEMLCIREGVLEFSVKFSVKITSWLHYFLSSMWMTVCYRLHIAHNTLT